MSYQKVTNTFWFRGDAGKSLGMALWFYLLPTIVGLSTVLQAGLNRQLAQTWGLAWTILFSNFWVVVLSALLVLSVKFFPDFFPDFLKGKFEISSLNWSHLVPGICGFCIVLFIPWSLVNLGASSTFVAMLLAQSLFALLWDVWVEKIPLTGPRVAGVLLVLLGVLVGNWKK